MKKISFLLYMISSLFSHVVINNGVIEINKKVFSYIEIKNKNLVRQKTDYSCGSASLATILKYYYEYNITEINILNMIMNIKGITKQNFVEKIKVHGGLSFLDLSKVSRKIGFKAIGLALDLNTLKKLKIPVILYVKIREDEHFTVFKGIDGEKVYLADPSFGNTKIRLSRFKEMFYQRNNLKYPGKILAIIPINSKKFKINKKFKQINKNNTIIKEIIMQKISQN